MPRSRMCGVWFDPANVLGHAAEDNDEAAVNLGAEHRTLATAVRTCKKRLLGRSNRCVSSKRCRAGGWTATGSGGVCPAAPDGPPPWMSGAETGAPEAPFDPRARMVWRFLRPFFHHGGRTPMHSGVAPQGAHLRGGVGAACPGTPLADPRYGLQALERFAKRHRCGRRRVR